MAVSVDPQSLKQPYWNMAHPNSMDASRRAAFVPDLGLDRSSAGENIGHYRLAVKFVNDPMGPGKKRSFAGIMNDDDDMERTYVLARKFNPRFAPQLHWVTATGGRQMQQLLENVNNFNDRDY